MGGAGEGSTRACSPSNGPRGPDNAQSITTTNAGAGAVAINVNEAAGGTGGAALQNITGAPLSHQPLIRHLRGKLGPLYELS